MPLALGSRELGQLKRLGQNHRPFPYKTENHAIIHSLTYKKILTLLSAGPKPILSLFSAWPGLTLGQAVLLFNSSTIHPPLQP
jgi:hypothetical protein